MSSSSLTFLHDANGRRAHIMAAVKVAGGNKAVGEALDVPETRVAQWKFKGTVPAAYCERLAELSAGLFNPARVRRNWAMERDALQQLENHATAAG